ncbi:MAG TPA: DinB family protein [Fimbriimonadaceae bacterium]|jgi:uncharacterized damage-inducible protein DinB
MNSYLVSSLNLAPAIYERLLAKIPPAKLDEATAEGRFSPREVIAHLADWEPIFLARLHQTLQKPGSTLEIWDENEMAVAHEYSMTEIPEQFARFREARAATFEFVRGLSTLDWDSSAVHPERGNLTVRDQIGMLLGHDVYHIDQLSEAI